MSCFNPMIAYLQREGEIDMRPKIDKVATRRWKMMVGSQLPSSNRYYSDTGEEVERTLIPCKKCDYCKQVRSRDWATRCAHEASLWEHNSFLTLTYANQHLPEYGSLSLEDMQLFFKSLRYHHPEFKLRYFYSGEYGDVKKTFRPHYHIALFNLAITDKKYWKTEHKNNNHLYTSSKIEDIWGKGRVVIGDLSYESAAYIARYTLKKKYGKESYSRYRRYHHPTGQIVQLKPEYSCPSRRGGGIGKGWFEKYWRDLYPSDTCVMNGFVSKPPEYYDKLLLKKDPEMYKQVKDKRKLQASKIKDTSFARLQAQQVHMEQRMSRLVRVLDESYN